MEGGNLHSRSSALTATRRHFAHRWRQRNSNRSAANKFLGRDMIFFGSAQELVRTRILGCFLENDEQFCVFEIGAGRQRARRGPSVSSSSPSMWSSSGLESSRSWEVAFRIVQLFAKADSCYTSHVYCQFFQAHDRLIGLAAVGRTILPDTVEIPQWNQHYQSQ